MARGETTTPIQEAIEGWEEAGTPWVAAQRLLDLHDSGAATLPPATEEVRFLRVLSTGLPPGGLSREEILNGAS